MILLAFIAPSIRVKATGITTVGTVAIGATGGGTTGGATGGDTTGGTTGAMFVIILGMFLKG